MLIKMRNDNSTNTVTSWNCEYFELIWAGVTRFMSYRQLAEIEGEVRKACALGGNISLADVCRFFGIEPGCDDEKLFFTQDFPLEFVIRESNEELLGASGPCKVWIVDFDYSPVMIEEEEEKQEKQEKLSVDNWDVIFSDLEAIKDFVCQNFYDAYNKACLLDKLDALSTKINKLEVK